MEHLIKTYFEMIKLGRIFFFLFTLVILLISYIHVFGATLSVEPASATVISVDQEFIFDLLAEKIVNLGAFQFDLFYDVSVLQLISIQPGDFLGSTERNVYLLGPSETAGLVSFGAYSQGSQEGPDGSGVLARISFKTTSAISSEVRLSNIMLVDAGIMPDLIDTESSLAAAVKLEKGVILTFTVGQNGTISGEKIQKLGIGKDSTPVTAVPDTNYSFKGWSGDYSGMENPLIINDVADNMKIIANFAPVSTLSVTPIFLDVPQTDGSALFYVSNSGAGTMNWTASEDVDWFSVNPSSGTDNITVIVSFDANNGKARNGIITITAPGSIHSPKTLEVRQASGLQPVLSVIPDFLEVPETSGSAMFEIKNTETGTLMNWTVSENADWFSINPGSGADNAIIAVNYESNFGEERTGLITITADAADSPKVVELVQEATKQPLRWMKMVTETSEDLKCVWGRSAKNIFAVGENGLILHYNGNIDNTWAKMTSNVSNDLRGVWGTDNKAFAVGNGGIILCYDGNVDNNVWMKMASNTSKDLFGIWGDSEKNIFAVGDSGTILYYNGSSWTKMPSVSFYPLYGVWGSSKTDVFAVGGNWNSSVILNYDNTGISQNWTEMLVSGADIPYGVWGASKDNVFAVGNSGTILRYSGNICNEMDSGTSEYLRMVWGSSEESVFAVGMDGIILHYDGSVWEKIASGISEDLYGIWGTSEGDMFAVGRLGTILCHRNADLGDAVSGLKILAGMESGHIYACTDADYNGKVELNDVIHILQMIAGLR